MPVSAAPGQRLRIQPNAKSLAEWIDFDVPRSQSSVAEGPLLMLYCFPERGHFSKSRVSLVGDSLVFRKLCL